MHDTCLQLVGGFLAKINPFFVPQTLSAERPIPTSFSRVNPVSGKMAQLITHLDLPPELVSAMFCFGTILGQAKQFYKQKGLLWRNILKYPWSTLFYCAWSWNMSLWEKGDNHPIPQAPDSKLANASVFFSFICHFLSFLLFLPAADGWAQYASAGHPGITCHQVRKFIWVTLFLSYFHSLLLFMQDLRKTCSKDLLRTSSCHCFP